MNKAIEGVELSEGELHGLAWTYSQKSGELLKDGERVACGYSGLGAGKDNPAMESVHDVGPIPRGPWRIVGPPVDTLHHGPYVLKLEPGWGTNTFERSGFLMHGDSMKSPGAASQGCVVLGREVREQVWKSGDRDFTVEE